MNGETMTLSARDGHQASAYEVRPQGETRGCLILAQEIFGVTDHIRRVCDDYAEHGYHVIAPAFFDRIRPGIELGYSKDDAITGRDLRSKIGWEAVFADVTAACGRLSGAGRIGILGYCWGGTIAWRAAGQIADITAGVCYYPTMIAPYIAEKPRCSVLMHFGERDPLATLEQAGQLRAAQGANVEIQVYPASHGFNCDEIANYHDVSSAMALKRTLKFLAMHLEKSQ